MKNTKQVIVVRAGLKMPPGKIAAQVAHASVSAVLSNIFKLSTWRWLRNSFTKVVVKVNSEKELFDIYMIARHLNVPHSILIQDSGKTVFNGVPTYTCVAIGPSYSEDIDLLTRNLELL